MTKFCKFCDICKIFAEFSQKLLIFQTDFCENFEIAAVQKNANLVELEKCCQTMSNAYFLAKFRFDTAEHFSKNALFADARPRAPGVLAGP